MEKDSLSTKMKYKCR